MVDSITRYAQAADGARIAFQVTGSASPAVLLVYEWISHQELRWEEPRFARFLSRLSAGARVVSFDKRGCGLSDPVALDAPPPLEAWADDVSVVLDAAEVDRCAVIAVGAGGPTGIAFAASHQERVSSLILVNTTACYARQADYPIGIPKSLQDRVRIENTTLGDRRGPSPFSEAFFGHELGRDERLVAWQNRYRRWTASPAMQLAANDFIINTDVRGLLPFISVPTLVIHRRDDAWTRSEHGRYLSEHIPAAKLVMLPGDEHAVFVGDIESLVGAIEEFITGSRRPPTSDRILATVLFTDIVRSTQSAAERGDRAWRSVLETHHSVAAAHVASNQGRLIKTTGDGIVATFDGPGRGIRCAQAIGESVHGLGLEIRAGLHTGELEVLRDDIAGMAVHIAARVADNAQAGEILVSSAIPPLVVGSDLTFTDRGERDLRDVPGTWRIFAVGNSPS